MRKRRFITFEGGEGGGKSTQIQRLAERLRALEGELVVTREPGGSPGAEALRTLLVSGAADRWSPMAETLLLYAARSDHLDRLIRPALERDAIVLCDRYLDSTRAYQGAAGGVDPHFIDALERSVVGSARPDLTLILDLDPAEGLRRAERRAQGGTRFEDMDLAFHQRLRSAFLAIAEREADRCVVIDASQSSEAVSAAIWAVVSGRMFQGADP